MSKKPPITKTIKDGGALYSVQLDPQTNQELGRTYLGMQDVKAPTAHYQLQPEVDATGKQTGRFLGYNTLTNAWIIGGNSGIANLGGASFSTAGGGTTNSLPVSALSLNASNARIYMQLLRSA